jgi:adenine-specific DNA-methyltransferase
MAPASLQSTQRRWQAGDVMRKSEAVEAAGDGGPALPAGFGLHWPGKAAAARAAASPPTAALVPEPEKSLDWDGTANLFVEGDNIDALKALAGEFAEAVKVVYADPPYNTGHGFVYADDFSADTGHRRADWASMMYPRLVLARDLLRPDGSMMLSIGDEEIAPLRLLLDEVFGAANHAATFAVVRAEGGGLAKHVVRGHDYLLVYAKDIREFAPLRRPKEIRGQIVRWRGEEHWIEEDWLRRRFGEYGTCEYDEIEKYHGERKRAEVDAGLSDGRYRLLEKRDGRVLVGRLRRVADDSSKFHSVQKHLNKEAASDFAEIGMPAVFDFPKPVSLIADLVLGATFHSKDDGDVVLDFFAGSGTTGHAVMRRNARDGGNRRYVLVQRPEPLADDNDLHRSAAQFCRDNGLDPDLSELTRERLRRAAAFYAREHPRVDTGFRSYRLV